MKSPITNPVHWRLQTLLSFDSEELHHLARTAAGTLTSYRLVTGRCLLALHHNKSFKKFGCASAIHYATAVLGLSSQEARTYRRVARLLLELPKLTLAAELGNIAWSKLREVVRKASAETESFWLELAKTKNCRELAALVKRTPRGALPGDVDTDEQLRTSLLRCHLSDEVFAMLAQARRVFSLEKGESVSNAEVLEWALASYISSQPADAQTLDKVRAEADKDLQAEQARQMPLVAEARELAEEILGGKADALGVCQAPTAEVDDTEDPITQALGAPPPQDCECSTRIAESSSTWHNIRLRYNPQNRHATKAQKKEILRRDGWCCSTPGCPNKVWLHLHHLKPYAQGGTTQPKNLISLCSGCHRNLHKGALKITESSQGKLVFSDAQGNRLDRQANLELAGWLDYWLGWRGEPSDSHTHRVHEGRWSVEVA